MAGREAGMNAFNIGLWLLVSSNNPYKMSLWLAQKLVEIVTF